MTAQADALMGIFGFKRVEGDPMDKVSETRRVLFQHAVKRDWLESMVCFQRKADGYADRDIDNAWWAFNAALDAVEIELPKERAKRKGFQHETLEDSTFNDCRYLCVDAIESTNLGIKVK